MEKKKREPTELRMEKEFLESWKIRDFWALQAIMFERKGKVWEELLGWLFIYLLKLFWTIKGKENFFFLSDFNGRKNKDWELCVWHSYELPEDFHMRFEYKGTTLSCVCSDQGHLEVQNISRFPSLLVLIPPLSILYNLSPRILLWVDNWSLLHIASAFAFLSVSSPKLVILLKYICKTMVSICTKLPIWQRTESKILIRTYEIQRDLHIDI